MVTATAICDTENDVHYSTDEKNNSSGSYESRGLSTDAQLSLTERLMAVAPTDQRRVQVKCKI